MSSFFTCFPSSATLATTNILESAGGHTQVQIFFIISVDGGQQGSMLLDMKFRSEFGNLTHHIHPMSPQLSGLFTSLVVLIVLLLIGPLFYFLPKVRLPLYRSYRCGKTERFTCTCLGLFSPPRQFWRASMLPASGRCSCSSRTYLSCGKSARLIL